jgi:hypothetical protein
MVHPGQHIASTLIYNNNNNKRKFYICNENVIQMKVLKVFAVF